ncbi:MAG: restriction endonuclease subunit S [Kiritimatiellae bacterium]|nr:restriction endonuclease subunit S [Kiritimatiellia bacterium]
MSREFTGQFRKPESSARLVKLKDVCERALSNLRQSDVVGENGPYPVFGAPGQIGSVGFYHQDRPYVAVVKDGAGIGRTMLLPEKSSVIGTLQYLLPKANVRVGYLKYAVQHMHLEKYFSGATIPHIYFRDYKNESFRLPSLQEQEEIVALLARVERITQNRRVQLSALDELVKARFVEMFGDESNSKEWPVVSVDSVADSTVGVVIKPAQYYTDAEHGVRAFRSLNVGPMCIKDASWVYFSREGHAKNAKSQLRENDLLVVRSGAPGTACVVPRKYAGSNAIDVIIVRPDTTKVNPHYLCMFTNLPHGKRQIDDGVGGAAQQHFNVGKYSKLRLMLPPLALQNRFATFVSRVESAKASVERALGETQTLFDSLMQEYFG